MKKQGTFTLIFIAAVFCSLTIGFYLGRNYSGSPVTVSSLSGAQTTVIAAQPVEQASSTITSPTLININTADMQTLMELPGIGETISRNIIAYRNAHGPFSSLEGLLDVDGIGQGRLEEILDLVTVGG